VRTRAWLLCILILLGAAFVACGGSSSGVTRAGLLPDDATGGVYLALGDSIAFGIGASDAERTDYVALVAEGLRDRFGDALEVETLAVPGHTTQDLIDEQLEPAVTRLRQGDVRLVTISIGGNDLNQYAAHAACVQDPTDPECPLVAGLQEVEARLDQIVAALREAGPETALVVVVYPNLFSGTGHPLEGVATQAFDLLDEVIVRVAQRYDALIADPRATFEGRADDLTHLLDPSPDFHPNDAGYRLIAQAILDVLEPVLAQ
jgi:lysophospholipase L1-like esterase